MVVLGAVVVSYQQSTPVGMRGEDLAFEVWGEGLTVGSSGFRV